MIVKAHDYKTKLDVWILSMADNEAIKLRVDFNL